MVRGAFWGFALFALTVLGLRTIIISTPYVSSEVQRFLGQASEHDTLQVIIWMKDQLDLNTIKPRLSDLSWPEQRVVMTELLKRHSNRTQQPILEFLQSQNHAAKVKKTFWIGNCLSVKATAQVIEHMLERSNVGAVEADMTCVEPCDILVEPSGPKSNNSEPNLKVINAHKLWKLGYTGKGTIVMNIDTGVELTHPALQASWRGNEPGGLPEHAWHDPHFGKDSLLNVSSKSL